MGTFPLSWYANTVRAGPPPLKYALPAASDVLPAVVNSMLLTVKSVVSTVADFPCWASCAFAWLARYSCTEAVNVPMEADWPSPWGACHGAPGYFEATGY